MSRQVGRCCALDENGKRCRRKAVRPTHYFGDPELFDGQQVRWVYVEFCDVHDLQTKWDRSAQHRKAFKLTQKKRRIREAARQAHEAKKATP